MYYLTTYKQSLIEETLCFGWKDSIIKRIDDEKYVRKFTPRKEKSKWSTLNVRRVDKMIRAGKMTPKGLALYQYAEKNKLLPNPDEVPLKSVTAPLLMKQALKKIKKPDLPLMR